MIRLFMDGGVIMWPLLAVAVAVVGLAIRAAIRLGRAGRAGANLGDRADRAEGAGEDRAGLGTILFWGGMAALLGLLGTVVGLVQMARAVQAAGEVGSRLVWGGVAVSLVSLVFGLLILVLAALFWLVLDHWSARSPNAASAD